MSTIAERVANGITWLTEHDELGAFHFWFESGIIPGSSPMPAQTPERIEAYREYYKARVTWERLWKAMEAEER
jgi:hypothetical protein